MTAPGSQAGRVALVTGASRGIGAAVATELARRGAHVVATARTQGGLEELDDTVRAAGGSATLLPLDLRDGAALDTLGPSLFERFRRLDVLVCNAAMLGRLTPAGHILPQDWADVVGANLSAAWRLIRSCGPLLQVATAGRAVFLTDEVVRQPRAYWGAYGATKAGMEHLALVWAEETRRSSLRVNLFDPGVVATRLRREAMPGEPAAGLTRPGHVAGAIADLCEVRETRHGQRVETPRG